MDKIKQVLSDFGRQLLRGVRARWWYLPIIAAAILLDQTTKRIAVNTLADSGREVVFIKNLITWRYYENAGSAYGMFADAPWVFMTVSTIGILLFILYLYGRKTRNPMLDLGLAFVIGGGIGNMIDRIALGYVVDFIGVSVGDFYLFNYTCNVADIFVCVGGALVFVAVLIQVIQEEKSKKEARAAAQADEVSTEDEETPS